MPKYKLFFISGILVWVAFSESACVYNHNHLRECFSNPKLNDYDDLLRLGTSSDILNDPSYAISSSATIGTNSLYYNV